VQIVAQDGDMEITGQIDVLTLVDRLWVVVVDLRLEVAWVKECYPTARQITWGNRGSIDRCCLILSQFFPECRI
jgi:hypothetical protein